MGIAYLIPLGGKSQEVEGAEIGSQDGKK